MKKIRKCYTCGAEYDYCPSCARSAGEPRWKLLFDKEECRDVFDVLSAYNMNLISDAEVKEVLDAHGVKSYDGYKASIKKQLQKIAPISGHKSVDIDLKE